MINKHNFIQETIIVVWERKKKIYKLLILLSTYSLAKDLSCAYNIHVGCWSNKILYLENGNVGMNSKGTYVVDSTELTEKLLI